MYVCLGRELVSQYYTFHQWGSKLFPSKTKTKPTSNETKKNEESPIPPFPPTFPAKFILPGMLLEDLLLLFIANESEVGIGECVLVVLVEIGLLVLDGLLEGLLGLLGLFDGLGGDTRTSPENGSRAAFPSSLAYIYIYI